MGDAAPRPTAAAVFGATPGPPDIDTLKARLDPEFRATNTAVAACEVASASGTPGGLLPGEREAWAGFYKAWRDYHDQNSWIQSTPPWPLLPINAPEVHADGLEREKRLRTWQELLANKCRLVAPMVQPPTPGTSAAAGFDAIKWIAIAAVVVAVAYVASPFVVGARKIAKK